MIESNEIKIAQDHGCIYTPPAFASFLADWAIQQSQDTVLDLGVGEGAFAFAAYERLCLLGDAKDSICDQIHGTEIRYDAYQKFLAKQAEQKIRLSNIINANFFDTAFPTVNAVIGNPPYVRRRHQKDVESIRNVISNSDEIRNIRLPSQTDLYIYFLLYACTFLKPGGRLAVIVADPWLNVSYGKPFKHYLLNHFHIHKLISLDRRVFDADVKAVMLLATKVATVDSQNRTQFLRAKTTFHPADIIVLESDLNSSAKSIQTVTVRQDELRNDFPWSVYLKAPRIHHLLQEHKRMVPLSHIASTRIGIQTLANDFFVLSPSQVQKERVESEYLKPLAYTPKSPANSILDMNTEPIDHLLFCAEKKENLADTFTLTYIQKAEEAIVDVRGKDLTVTGYQNKDRIKRAGRVYWYDLKSSIEKRGCAQILLPRFIYHDYRVVWNKAGFVPPENFIEILPSEQATDDIEVLLAILSSSITELAIRIYSQVYGGGTYSVGPGMIKSLPVLNMKELAREEKEELLSVYRKYTDGGSTDRTCLDQAIYKFLQCSEEEQLQFQEVLKELLNIASASKSRC